MRDIFKNPILYYILAPIATGLWPLLLWAVYLPASQRNWDLEQGQYKQGQTLIAEILALDPDRLAFVGVNNAVNDFSYAPAVDRVANLCKIPSNSYRLSAGGIMTSSGKKSQTAKVVLTNVDIVRFARFLSTIQSLWVNLQCDKVKLTQKESSPDQWTIELDLKYYY
jgi:hypothetical protein